MNLTPIAIPGKRRRRGEGKKIQTPGKPPKRGLGPNLQMVGIQEHWLEQDQLVAKRKKRSLKNLKSRRKMSRLEKLPTEVLELVYLYAMNIDLPRSSPIIGGKLSSESVYHQTILAAFGPTWDRLHDDVKHIHRREPVDYFLAGLQGQVLSCRWAWPSVILKAKDAWMIKNNKQIAAWWFVIPDPPPPKPNAKSIDSNTELKGSDTESDEFRSFYHECYGKLSDITAERYFEIDFSQFTKFCSPASDDLWPSQVCTVDIERAVEVADSLLSGPWNEDQIKLLYWIVKSGAQIDWLKSTCGEVAFGGLMTAISTGDTRAIQLLCWIGACVKINTNLVTWALRNVGGNRIETMKHLLVAHNSLNELGFVPTVLDPLAIEQELEIYKAEALRANDLETLNFVVTIESSRSLKSALTFGIDGRAAETDPSLRFGNRGEIGL
ncbi:hypothetical protein BJ875DRAFT_457351 [Amylocarpus encephaloides]|uniref:Uncharacterized protein n=1 Tax=Amylocarpus encephaloides TaxID=45428 RepID=A0A9P8C6T8_9HELO|nr:hypothetical protein BJ875DRAFT_457351 [Amylocarpus encephaloides]